MATNMTKKTPVMFIDKRSNRKITWYMRLPINAEGKPFISDPEKLLTEMYGSDRDNISYSIGHPFDDIDD